MFTMRDWEQLVAILIYLSLWALQREGSLLFLFVLVFIMFCFIVQKLEFTSFTEGNVRDLWGQHILRNRASLPRCSPVPLTVLPRCFLSSTLNMPKFDGVLLTQTWDSPWNPWSAPHCDQHHLTSLADFLSNWAHFSWAYTDCWTSGLSPPHPTRKHQGYPSDMQMLLFHYSLSE